MAEPTIAAMAARAVVMAGGMELAARANVAPELLADVDGRVPVSVMLALWREAEKADPDFGLHLGVTAVTVQFALPWHLLHASATLGEGIGRLATAWRVFNDIHPPEILIPDANGDAVIRIRTKDTPYPVPRQAIEYAFAWFVEASRKATGSALAPRHVTFEHPRPENTTEHDRIFGCPITFGADYAEIVFPADRVALPTVTGGDPSLIELLERHTQNLLAKLPPLPSNQPFSATVRDALTPLLVDGDVTIERIATVLGTSARSIQRRLHDEETTFQRVLDALRKDVAEAYLGDPMRSIAEIALLLGFSDQTAFHRAFVRWTGRTPGDVRRSLR